MFIAGKADDKHNLIEVDNTETQKKKPLLIVKIPEDVTVVVIQMNIQMNLIPEQTNEEKTKDKTKNMDNPPNAVYRSNK